jgi:hypothetical protein
MREKLKDKNEEMKLVVQDIFKDFKTVLVKFENNIDQKVNMLDDKLNEIEQKQDELEDYYKPTHKKKLGLNGFIKSSLGDNATKENVGRATEQLLFLLGDYTAYQEVPKDVLENSNTKSLAYDICKNINLSINRGIEIN